MLNVKVDTVIIRNVVVLMIVIVQVEKHVQIINVQKKQIMVAHVGEIIIVNHKSNDDSMEIAKSFRHDPSLKPSIIGASLLTSALIGL